MGAVLVKLSRELMAQAIGLSEEARLVGMRYDLDCGVLVLRIEHPGLPHVAEGAAAPTVDFVSHIEGSQSEWRFSQTLLPGGSDSGLLVG